MLSQDHEPKPMEFPWIIYVGAHSWFWLGNLWGCLNILITWLKNVMNFVNPMIWVYDQWLLKILAMIVFFSSYVIFLVCRWKNKNYTRLTGSDCGFCRGCIVYVRLTFLVMTLPPREYIILCKVASYAGNLPKGKGQEMICTGNQ